MKLPPLPEPTTRLLAVHTTQRDTDLFTADQLRAHGETCARAALEEAAKVCENMYRKWNHGSENADRYRIQDETVESCVHFIRAIEVKHD